jgi:hypothetical protein
MIKKEKVMDYVRTQAGICSGKSRRNHEEFQPEELVVWQLKKQCSSINLVLAGIINSFK